MTPRRPALHVETLLLLGVLYLLLASNTAFWQAALASRSWAQPSTWGFAGAALAALSGAYFFMASPFAWRRTVRPLLAALFIVASVVAYFSDRYAVYFDRAMLRNVLATNPKEARELLGWALAGRVLVFGLLPAALLWWPRLRTRPTLLRTVAVRVGWALAALLVAGGSLMLVFADAASLVRNNREVRHLINPGNVIAATLGNVAGSQRRGSGPLAVVGGDAVAGPAWAQRQRRSLVVLVVGETARAQNFSLNGYARATNPELAALDVVNWPDAWACGTSTEVSLPCMFSPFGRRNYDEQKIQSHESVLHVLARAGFDVRWRDNQSGCKGVCQGLPALQLDHAAVPGLCESDQCFDEVLLHGMDAVLADAGGNLVVVMHQLGSHGPSYYRRYPPAFKRFEPACETDDLRLCSPEQIRNAYDNSLLYTDHVLARVIAFLKEAEPRYDTAMLYLSDHGESLGEKGLYLHGMPYSIAPDEQRHIPMLAWFSASFQHGFGLDVACLRRQAGAKVSHDNLFHSLLGLLDVRTSAYEAQLDIFAGCRGTAAATALKPKAPPP